MKNQKNRILLSVSALVLVCAVLLSGCGAASSAADSQSTPAASSQAVSSVSSTVTEASKAVTVTVVDGDGASTEFALDTDQEFLRGALEEAELVEGEESEYGLFVTTVNGITADQEQEQWWCFTKNGEALETGVDTTPIADGDAFEVTLTTGW